MSKEKQVQESISIEVSPFERVVISAFLPHRASVHIGQKIIKMRERLDLTMEEENEYKVEYMPNGSVAFNNKHDLHYTRLHEMTFSESEFKIIKDAFKKADKEERLPTDKNIHNLYEKIMSK